MIAHENNKSYDVVVIGAGPAGTTAATFLQNAGHRCLVLDKATFPRYHIGESLIPHTFGTLDRLGMLPKLNASLFPQKHSVRFVSPHGNESDPFYFSETIEGSRAQTWQVVRSEFDQICLDNAIENGVKTKMNTNGIANKIIMARRSRIKIRKSFLANVQMIMTKATLRFRVGGSSDRCQPRDVI